jgi:hypothetical protein
MHDVLITLQTDLASSIAIRFMCQIEKFGQFNLQTAHVPDLEKDGHPPASGWVHKIWEDEIVGKARKDISKLIQEENIVQYNRLAPLVLLGKRDQVILNELQHKDYDIFMEGLLHSFEPDIFFKKIDSDLYRNSPCPILMVKNLVKLDRGIQLVGTPDRISLLLPWFCKFWKDQPLKVDVLICQIENQAENITILENDDHLVSELENGGLRHRTAPYTIKTAKGSSKKLASLVRDHALIMSFIPESKGNMAHMIAMSPCPILFCPRGKIN